MMSSPGSGKTSILEATIPLIMKDLRIGVLEGDVATTIDADRIEKFDIPVIQITTESFRRLMPSFGKDGCRQD